MADAVHVPLVQDGGGAYDECGAAVLGHRVFRLRPLALLAHKVPCVAVKPQRRDPSWRPTLGRSGVGEVMHLHLPMLPLHMNMNRCSGLETRSGIHTPHA